MKIKMLESRRGSPDGHKVCAYEIDREYDVPDSLARDFVSKGWATEVAQVGLTSGYNNICIGAQRNICIGTNTGRNLTTASHCVLLGDGAGDDVIDQNYQFRLKTEDAYVRKTMTPEQFESLYSIILGGNLTYTGDM